MKINGKAKIISAVSIITAIFAIFGGIWAFDDRYAKNEMIAELEVQVVQSLKQYNMQQMKVQQTYELKNEYRFYQFLYDKLGQDLLEIRRLLRRSPEDQILRQDYIDTKAQRDSVKVKMDSLMERIR